MSNEKTYRANEVCEILGISIHTFQKWYQWEKAQLKDGSITKNYLPVPEKLTNQRGKPKYWTEKQVQQLKEYKSTIVVGRYGKYGKYSNPLHNKKEETENE